jgi:anti-sigma B factor antagonist
MLNIGNEKNGNKLTVTLEGRLDTTTAPELEESVKGNIDGVTELIFEIAPLEYISSAGLRVLLATQKIMNKQGSMVVRNASEEVKEIFEVTGFYDILNIE